MEKLINVKTVPKSVLIVCLQIYNAVDTQVNTHQHVDEIIPVLDTPCRRQSLIICISCLLIDLIYVSR